MPATWQTLCGVTNPCHVTALPHHRSSPHHQVLTRQLGLPRHGIAQFFSVLFKFQSQISSFAFEAPGSERDQKNSVDSTLESTILDEKSSEVISAI